GQPLADIIIGVGNGLFLRLRLGIGQPFRQHLISFVCFINTDDGPRIQRHSALVFGGISSHVVELSIHGHHIILVPYGRQSLV
ncbi:MAG: hypothetical protein KC592_18160, partial [Nitrospira sp.]|nr:hypothetical protein [Nitrospira sp.]